MSRTLPMSNSRNKIGLALGIASVFLFGGTLPATRLNVSAIVPLFLTAARATAVKAGMIAEKCKLILPGAVPPKDAGFYRQL